MILKVSKLLELAPETVFGRPYFNNLTKTICRHKSIANIRVPGPCHTAWIDFLQKSTTWRAVGAGNPYQVIFLQPLSPGELGGRGLRVQGPVHSEASLPDAKTEAEGVKGLA